MARKIKQTDKRAEHVELIDKDVRELLNGDKSGDVPAARVRLIYNRNKRRFEIAVEVSNDKNGNNGLVRTKKLGVRRLIRALHKNGS